MGGEKLYALFEDSDLSGLPSADPAGGKPWKKGLGAGFVITIGAADGIQPLDADLTAIAALTTTTFGRSLLTQADAAATRSTIGAVNKSGDTMTGALTLNTSPLNIGGTNQYFSWTNQASVSFVSNSTSLIGLHGGALNVNLGTNTLGFGSSTGYGVTDILVGRESAGCLKHRGDSGTKNRNYADTADTPVRGGQGVFSDLVYIGPLTYVAITAMSASANNGARARVTDRGGRMAYSDGTDWRWEETGAKIAETPSGAIVIGGISGSVGPKKLYFRVPYACTITSWELVGDVSGSIVIDIWKSSYAAYPPVVGGSITGSAKPSLSTAQKAQSSTLTGWTTALNQGDYIEINVDSVTSIGTATLTLNVARQ